MKLDAQVVSNFCWISLVCFREAGIVQIVSFSLEICGSCREKAKIITNLKQRRTLCDLVPAHTQMNTHIFVATCSTASRIDVPNISTGTTIYLFQVSEYSLVFTVRAIQQRKLSTAEAWWVMEHGAIGLLSQRVAAKALGDQQLCLVLYIHNIVLVFIPFLCRYWFVCFFYAAPFW